MLLDHTNETAREVLERGYQKGGVFAAVPQYPLGIVQVEHHRPYDSLHVVAIVVIVLQALREGFKMLMRDGTTKHIKKGLDGVGHAAFLHFSLTAFALCALPTEMISMFRDTR